MWPASTVAHIKVYTRTKKYFIFHQKMAVNLQWTRLSDSPAWHLALKPLLLRQTCLVYCSRGLSILLHINVGQFRFFIILRKRINMQVYWCLNEEKKRGLVSYNYVTNVLLCHILTSQTGPFAYGHGTHRFPNCSNNKLTQTLSCNNVKPIM